MRLYQCQKKNDDKICYTRSEKAGVDEIIVVANGADFETVKHAKLENVIVVEFTKALGHNVARAIGAMHATQIFVYSLMVILLFQQKLTPFCKLLKMEVTWF